tara:strand:- start:240 stop:437 length:198 start_codon:yes stop_codon:yes gene_type:complete
LAVFFHEGNSTATARDTEYDYKWHINVRSIGMTGFWESLQIARERGRQVAHMYYSHHKKYPESPV